MRIAKRKEFFFSGFPIRLGFRLRYTAGIADTFFVEMDGLLDALRTVLEFDRAIGALVADHAFPAELNL